MLMVISQKAKKYFQRLISCIAYRVGNKSCYNYVVGARCIVPLHYHFVYFLGYNHLYYISSVIASFKDLTKLLTCPNSIDKSF